MGGSAGMALHAAIQVCRESRPDKNVLVILPDGGRPYLSKVFDDAWMIEHGFLERVGEAPSIAQVLRAKATDARRCRRSSRSAPTSACREAIALLQQYGISQLPVIRRQNGDTARRSTSATWSARCTSATCSTTSSRTTTR